MRRDRVSAWVLILLVGVASACTTKTSKSQSTPSASGRLPSGAASGAAAVLGDAAISGVDVVARSGVFQAPLDAAPGPDGSTIYFTARAANGAPAVFRVTATGGTPVTVTAGAPLATPVGIAVSGDGAQVFVADPGAGALFAVPAAGGAPTPVTGTAGWRPRGLDVASGLQGDTIWFTGIDPASKVPGLFTIPGTGGTPSVVAEGAGFVAPDGVSATGAEGASYVSDQGTGTTGTVLSVTQGSVTPKIGTIRLGNPGGLAVTKDGKRLLVSTLGTTSGSDQLLFLDLTSGRSVAATKVIGGSANSSGGLHRARNLNDFAWADTQGTVYRIRLP